MYRHFWARSIKSKEHDVELPFSQGVFQLFRIPLSIEKVKTANALERGINFELVEESSAVEQKRARAFSTLAR